MPPYSVHRLEGQDSNPSCLWVRGTEDLLSSRYQKETSLQDPRLYCSFGTIETHHIILVPAIRPKFESFHLQILNFLLICCSLSQQDKLLHRQGCCISIPTLFSHLKTPHSVKNVSLHLHLSKMKHGVPFLLWTMWPKWHQIQTCWCLVMRLREIFIHFFCKDGRSDLKGSRYVQKKHFLHGPHYLIVPFITLDGIITYEIIEGPVSSEHVTHFLQEYIVSHCYFMGLIDTVASSHHCIVTGALSFSASTYLNSWTGFSRNSWCVSPLHRQPYSHIIRMAGVHLQ